MGELVPQPAWARRRGEHEHHYAWFVHYAELGPTREIGRAASLCGVPTHMLEEAAAKNDWDARVAPYDEAVISLQQAVAPDSEEALAMQYHAGRMVMRLGIDALKLKSPNLIGVKEAITMVGEGAEMTRRGAGVADINVNIDVVTRIEQDVELLLGVPLPRRGA